jgi:hypothetical protein
LAPQLLIIRGPACQHTWTFKGTSILPSSQIRILD